jgi:hypothetical protein
MPTKIQFRRDTASNWTSNNPTLSEGELGLETDTRNYKIGNGSSAWNSLSYAALSGTFNSVSLDAIADPSAPASGIIIYAKNIGGRVLPKFIGPSGLDSVFQPAIFGNGMSIVLPASSTNLSPIGMATMSAVGTISHPALSANTLRESTRRAIVTSAATTPSASELRYTITQCWRGNGDGLGGFYAVFRFGISSAVSTQRIAVGLWAATGATSTSAEPSALVSGVWVGNDAADANLQLMYNDASGAASKIDLGATYFAKNIPNAIYELTLFAKPNGDRIYYRVKRLDVVGEVSGEITTDLPPQTTFLAPHLYANNGATASAVVLEFYRYYLESDL